MNLATNGKGPRHREPLPIDRTRAECIDAGAEDLASEYLDELAALVGLGDDYCREVCLAAQAAAALADRPIARLLWKRDYLAKAFAMRCARLRHGRASGTHPGAAVLTQ